MPSKGLTLNFTKAALNAIEPAPVGRRVYYNDTLVRGLQLMVTGTGTKSFYLYKRVHGKPYRDFLGSYPELTVENARKKAQASAGRVAMGEDLRETKHQLKREQVTLSDAFIAFKASRKNLKASTLYSYERFIERAFEDWRTRPLVDLSKDSVAARHKKLGTQSGPAYADGAMRFLRSLINFAQFQYEGPTGAPLLPDNPVKRISQTRAWYRVKRRTGYIKPDQLKAWFEAVLALKEDPDYYEANSAADWLLLIILTGLRRGEALALRWADVDFKNKTLTVRDTKNHDDHTLPLSDYLLALFEARNPNDPDTEFVFASYGKHGYMNDPRTQLNQVMAKSELHFTPHDLRRTFITIAESLDIPAYALKRLLNHKMRQDVTAGYIITDVERLRKPMQMITDYILKCAGLKASASVTELPVERAQ